MKNEKDYTLHYEKWHNTSQQHLDFMNRYYAGVFESDLEFISKKIGKPIQDLRLLDFGCGMGLFLNYCRSRGLKNISGFELDAGQASVAKSLGLSVEQNDVPMAWLQSTEKEFDVIFSIDVLEHVPLEDSCQTVSYLREKLADGGFLVATVPNANSTVSGRWRYIDWTHRTSFTEHSLTHLFQQAGFVNAVVTESEIARFYASKPSFLKLSISKALLKVSRAIRRLQYIGEFGWDEGLTIPISTNIKVTSRK